MGETNYRSGTVERDDALTIVNALDAAAEDELEAAFDAFAADDGQWIAAGWSYLAMTAMPASKDAVERPAAFAAMRAPHWVGR